MTNVFGPPSRREFLATAAAAVPAYTPPPRTIMLPQILVLLLLVSLPIGGCASAAPGVPAPVSAEEEARGFMAELEAEIHAGDLDAILHRYSRRGVYLASFGAKTFVPYAELVAGYNEGWVAPVSFELDDLSFEVVDADAVAVVGSFRLKWSDEQGFAGTYTSLLVREDGELRIRLEAESMANLDPSAWCPDEAGCEVALASPGQARYVGEYALGSLSYRIYQDAGDLMVEGPFREPRTRLLYLGNDQFRLEDVQDVRLVFDGSPGQPASLTIFRDVFLGRAHRMER
jgi:hypothetical protein